MTACIIYPVTATLAIAGTDEQVALGASAPGRSGTPPDIVYDSAGSMRPSHCGLWRFTARMRLKNDAIATVTEVQATLLDQDGNRVIEVTNVVTIVLGDRHTLTLGGIVNRRSNLDVYTLWWRADGGTPTIDGSDPAYAAVEWEFIG